MNKEDILNAAKELHYSEKLELAQKLIQIARKDLEQITCQFRPATVVESAPVTMNNDAAATTPVLAKDNTNYSLNDIAKRLKKNKCKTEKTALNSIKSMYQYHGGISEENAQKTLQKMIEQKIFRLNEKKQIIWEE